MFKNAGSKSGGVGGGGGNNAQKLSSSAPVESKDSVWDFLNKNRGIQGYGGKAVDSWGGGKAEGGKDVGRKTLDDPVDSEDEEMDKGKIKKVKKKNPISAAFSFKSNPFQKQYENNAKKMS